MKRLSQDKSVCFVSLTCALVIFCLVSLDRQRHVENPILHCMVDNASLPVRIFGHNASVISRILPSAEATLRTDPRNGVFVLVLAGHLRTFPANFKALRAFAEASSPNWVVVIITWDVPVNFQKSWWMSGADAEARNSCGTSESCICEAWDFFGGRLAAEVLHTNESLRQEGQILLWSRIAPLVAQTAHVMRGGRRDDPGPFVPALRANDVVFKSRPDLLPTKAVDAAALYRHFGRVPEGMFMLSHHILPMENAYFDPSEVAWATSWQGTMALGAAWAAESAAAGGESQANIAAAAAAATGVYHTPFSSNSSPSASLQQKPSPSVEPTLEPTLTPPRPRGSEAADARDGAGPSHTGAAMSSDDPHEDRSSNDTAPHGGRETAAGSSGRESHDVRRRGVWYAKGWSFAAFDMMLMDPPNLATSLQGLDPPVRRPLSYARHDFQVIFHRMNGDVGLALPGYFTDPLFAPALLTNPRHHYAKQPRVDLAANALCLIARCQRFLDRCCTGHPEDGDIDTCRRVGFTWTNQTTTPLNLGMTDRVALPVGPLGFVVPPNGISLPLGGGSMVFEQESAHALALREPLRSPCVHTDPIVMIPEVQEGRMTVWTLNLH
eukprot:TRINITY_DN21458_c0_g1_i1.p1 TRINITY_DN21458_c0_g1~~TRINITY_DN21458_c0_g1_i1.p1  ORF type:complete len:609 (-),score=74.15 TRINITY_DN21458_c0_g1_i1:126-1952(-)